MSPLRGLVIRWAVNAVALFITAEFVDGVAAHSTEAILVAAALLGIVNAFVRPLLILLTLPLNIITLGLFTFVINALLLRLVASAVSGFEVAGFGPAFVGALVLSLVSSLINYVVRDR